MKRFLLDTHTWIWWNCDSKKLSGKVKQVISDAKNYDELLLSAISPWEFAKLLEKEHLRVSLPGDRWIHEALDMPRLRLIPLTPEIAWHSTNLPQPFHDDPADQIIVATARLEQATIISCDKLIRKYEHVSVLW